MSDQELPITSLLSSRRSTHFRVTYRDGQYTGGDSASFFARKLPDHELTFDVSNNKALVNISANGSIKAATIYRGQHGADDIPGVWMHKDFARAGPFAFVIEVDGETIDFLTPDIPFTTSLLANVFPVSDYQHAWFNATTVTFAPIAGDGSVRSRCAVHGMLLTNTTEGTIKGQVRLPLPRRTPDAPFARPEICVHLAELPHSDIVDFELVPGASVWVPAVIHAFGDATTAEISAKGSAWWLAQTLNYMKRMTGSLSMPDDPFAAEFFERAVHQCFGAVGMDAKGAFVGSNWGTYPTTQRIWNRDYFYSLLPFHMLEPEFFRLGMEWFTRHGTRPPGNAYEGGITHSLTNALSGALMGGLYYRSTGDGSWFRNNPVLEQQMRSALDGALESREDGSALIPSLFLSDGYSLGDVHTGSNVFAWTTLTTYATVQEDVLRDPSQAAVYAGAAAALKMELESSNTINGTFGRQYLEGVSQINADDPTREPVAKYEGEYRDFGMRYVGPLIRGAHIDLLHHDGEESDTILMPHFGYCAYDAPHYRQYMQFTMSRSNPTYNPESRGMQWGDKAAATFPGYMNGMGLIVDDASLSGAQGYLTEIRKLTDLDGSLWWWPYYNGAAYGDIVRHHNCGKCGWASGVFAAMFVSEILGVAFDAPTRTLRFRPFSPSSSFRWDDFRLGSGRFSAGLTREPTKVEAMLTNHGSETIAVDWSVPLADGWSLVDDGTPRVVDYQTWNGMRTATFRDTLEPGATKRVSARP